MNRKQKITPAYCEQCGKQLTWFTWHNVWENGKFTRLCTDCWLAKTNTEEVK